MFSQENYKCIYVTTLCYGTIFKNLYGMGKSSMYCTCIFKLSACYAGKICDPLSKNPTSLHIFKKNSVYFVATAQGMEYVNFSIASIVLDNKNSKEINLFSIYARNKLQVLTFTVITFVCSTSQYWGFA